MKTENKIIIILCFFMYAVTLSAQTPIEYYTTIDETASEAEIIKIAANVVPAERQLAWQKMELTAFIHFGINTFSDREWGDGSEDPRLFNPETLNAEQWVKICKDAGFKLVILTVKHHDGFCLWPSKYTAHSVKNSIWKDGKGDVVEEIASACKKNKMGLGIYLSPWDRNSPVYGTDVYNDYFVNQLTELLTQYGKVDEVWFDGANGEGKNGKKQVYDFERWYQLIRKLQPQAVIAVMGPDLRWVGTETGRGRETEWSVVPIDVQSHQHIAEGSQTSIMYKPKGDMQGNILGSREQIKNAKALVWYPAETDVSIRPGWFYHDQENDKVKTPQQLNDIYFSSVGRNGVLLLNIPPNKKGLIAKEDSLSLMQWAKLRRKTFKNNLIKKAEITLSSGINAKNLIDGDYKSYWTTASPKDTTAEIEFTFTQKQTFDVVSLQENITVGQRIEKFVCEYWNGKKWVSFIEGTTVGYKRLMRFNPVSTRKVKLKILSSRLNPTLSEVGFFRQ